ncbi:MAG: acyl-CoA dehydrogenase family protein [Candidatus Paceibacterota bacterium]
MEPLAFEDKKHKDFRKTVKKFIEEEVSPNALEWEKTRHIPLNLLKKLSNEGLTGLSLPKEVGGKNEDFWHEVILAEELAQSRTLGWALSILVQTNMVAPLIFQLGNKKQKENILKPALSGEFYLALAVTDPSSGSDLASTTTTALPDGESYVLNGEKRYITNGSVANYLVVLARTKNDKDIWSLGLFLIPADIKGIKRERLITSGLKTSDTASIVFKDCVIPKENALGDSTRGFLYLLRGLQRERLIGAVALNSLALYVWEDTLIFLQNRHRFGEPLSKKQVIRHRMIELRTNIEAARQFTYSVCDAFAREKSVDKEILMLKMYSYENCQKVVDECIHLRGAEGFLENHWLSHVRQDAQAFSLAAGSAEIIRDLLAGMFKM